MKGQKVQDWEFAEEIVRRDDAGLKSEWETVVIQIESRAEAVEQAQRHANKTGRRVLVSTSYRYESKAGVEDRGLVPGDEGKPFIIVPGGITDVNQHLATLVARVVSDLPYEVDHQGVPVGFRLADGRIARPLLAFEIESEKDGLQRFKIVSSDAQLQALGLQIVFYVESKIEKVEREVGK